MSMTDPLIGQQLGDYKIEGVLGTGGMARVYRGRDENLDRYAAIKVIEPQLIASTEEDEYRERFLREARAIARLNHPRIVSVYQFNQVSNLYYIAMEYVEGRNLREILKEYLQKDELMPPKPLLKILGDIADALDYAHKQSIIHRDVKPSNIIVTDEGNAVLTDFGLALNAVEGTIGNTFGSVHYIAPEQAISSAQAVPQSDQYSLGVVAYEMLTGRVPFDDASAMSVALKHISDPPPPPTELNPNIPPEVEQVILKALDKEVSDRYDTAREFVKSLDMAFEMMDQSSIAPPPQMPKEGIKPDANGDDDEDTDTAGGVNDATDDQSEEKTAAVMSDDVTGTSSDSSRSKAPTPEPVASSDDRGNRWWAWLAAVVVLLTLSGIFFALQTMNQQNATATETAVAALGLTRSSEETATESAELAAIAARETEGAATDAAQSAATSTANAADTEAAQLMSTATEAAESTMEETAELDATNTSQPTDTPDATATPPDTNTPAPTATPSNTPRPTRTPRPSDTPTPDIVMGADAAAPQVLLRYDGRMIVIGNRDPNEALNVEDLRFVLFEPNEDGDIRRTVIFDVSDERFANAATRFNPERCLQVLDGVLFSALPQENPLADDLCGGRPFWVTTTDPFWVSSNPQEAYFEVRLGPVDVLTRCPANIPQTRVERRCAVDLNVIP